MRCMFVSRLQCLFCVLEREECKRRTFKHRLYLTHFIVSMD